MYTGKKQQQPTFTRIKRPRTAARELVREPEKSGPGGGFILMLLAGTAIIVLGAWFLFLQPAIEDPDAAAEPPPDTLTAAGFDYVTDKEARKILHLKPPFVVNLAGLDGRWVMNVQVWLEVDSFAAAAELNRNPAIFYRMMDDLTRTLKSWTYAELNFGNGMERLKNQLRDHAQRYIADATVVRVLFPDVRFTEMLPKAPPPEEETEPEEAGEFPPVQG